MPAHRQTGEWMSANKLARVTKQQKILFAEILVRGSLIQLPRDPLLLRSSLCALLKRWQRRHREEVGWITDELAWLAGMEALFHDASNQDLPVTREDCYRTSIELISRESLHIKRRKHHRPMVLRIQRDILKTVFQEHPRYPSSRPMNDRRHWLESQWIEMFSRLQGIPCWCNYNLADLSGPPKTSILDSLKCYHRKSELIIELLAYLHRTKSSQQIEKLLRPDSSNSVILHH
jgi:hypothetical protein